MYFVCMGYIYILMVEKWSLSRFGQCVFNAIYLLFIREPWITTETQDQPQFATKKTHRGGHSREIALQHQNYF